MKKGAFENGILLASLSCLLLSCSSGTSFQKIAFAMDTEITCQAKAQSESELTEVLSLFEEVEAYSDASYHHYQVVGIYDINKSDSPVEISKELYDLLSFALDMQEATKGYFNPLCLGLDDLWKDSLHPSGKDASPSIPSQDRIDEELAKISNTSLKLGADSGTYTAFLETKDPSLGRACLDLGGIAKGYAAEKAKEKAVSLGWKTYFINGGNSTMVLGEAEKNGGYFSISWKEDLPGRKLKAKDVCLSTSSVTVQGVEIGGKMYSHLINPFTGEASPSITGVTLLGEDAGMLDAFSTALMWMDEESRIALEQKYGIKAVYYKGGEVLRDGIGLENS